MKIISFFGHRDYIGDERIESLIKSDIINKIKTEGFDNFYLGGNGNFDGSCARIVSEIKKDYPYIISSLVLAYPNPKWKDWQKEYILRTYDCHFQPDFPITPSRFAIIKRNEWIIENSDYIIFYVNHSWGGAYRAFEYAKRKKKIFINYGSLNK